MSLGDAYTLGVRLTGDITLLRSELRQGTQLIGEFSSQAIVAMNRAASAMTYAAATMQAQANKTTTAHQRQAAAAGQAATRYSREQINAAHQIVMAQRQIQDATQRTETVAVASSTRVMRVLAQFAGIGGLALIAKQVWDIGFGFNEFTQNTQISLTSLMGSAGQAKAFLADVLEFAKQTPYAFPDLTAQAQQLLTWGFNAQQVIPILRAAGDAATTMGKGKDGVDRLVLALGQINTKGRLQSQELLQLSEVGVNGLKILANQAGMTTVDYQKLVSDGLVPANVAVQGIVKGLNEGTSGVNGQTAAFGGMMEKIKAAGGITATLDATRTSIRNTAGEITKNLVPASLSTLRGFQDVLGVLKIGAQVFGALPTPVQSAALAFTAASVAMRVLNLQARGTSVWQGFRASMDASRATAQALGYEIRRAGAAGLALRASGPNLLSAFGGPAGLAIAGVTAALAAYSGAQANARRVTQELADTLDTQTLALTASSTEWVKNNLLMDQNFGFSGNKSMTTAAKELGIGIDDLTDAYLGNAAAYEKIKKTTTAFAPIDPDLGVSTNDTAAFFLKYLDDQRTRIQDAIEITKEKRRIDEAANAELNLSAKAYKGSAQAIREWTEDEAKALETVSDAASKAFLSGLDPTGWDLNLSTVDDVADAQDRVAESARDVRDAEANLQEVRDRKKHTANDIQQAEDRITDARKRAEEAAADLTNAESRRDPVAAYRKQLEQMTTDAEAFAKNITTLAEGGLNATTLLDLINKGPQGSKDTVTALLQDPSLIGETNTNQAIMEGLGRRLADQATVAQSSLMAPGTIMGDNLALGFKIAALKGTATSIEDIATQLGSSPAAIYRVGADLGLAFLNGFSDTAKWRDPFNPMTGVLGRASLAPGQGSGTTAYAGGGVLPGYTPGRDIYRFASRLGVLDLGGGEAIMRPEFTRAVGPGFVNAVNRVARTGGPGGVLEAMRRYLGGFAGGGILGPNVVTVPVHSTNERYSPVTVQKAYVVDAASLGLYGDRTRAQRNTFGGNRG